MRASLLTLALLAAGCGSEHPTGVPPAARFNPGLLEVSTAEVTVAQSSLPRAFLHVRGGGAPCTRVGPVTQHREGNVIDVRLETYWEVEFCILLLVQVEHTTALEGPFERGEYVVRANGVEVHFRI